DRMTPHVATGSPAEAAQVALVKASLAALGSAHEAAFLATVADDAVVDELIEPRPFTGSSGARDWVRRWAAAVPGATTETTTVEGVENWVLLEMLLRGTLRGDLGPLEASGGEFTVHRAVLAQVRDGKIARLSAFMNGKELAQATGQWPLPAMRSAPVR